MIYLSRSLKGFIPVLIFLFIGGEWGVSAASSVAAGEWTMTLTVSTPFSTAPGEVVSNSLSAGVRNGATRGYDNASDTVSFLEPDDPVQAYFPHGAVIEEDSTGSLKGWGCPNPEAGYNAYQCSLWRDFRPLGDSDSWTFEVLSPINGATINLGWRIDIGESDLANMELTLVDLSSSPPIPPVRIDQASSYSYTNIFVPGKKYGLRRFEIRMKARGLFILPSILPPGTLNSPYNQTLSVTGGGAMWSLEEGDLPPGLMLNASSGKIVGIPLGEGLYTFTVRAGDPIRGLSTSHPFNLSIAPALTITTPELSDGEVHTLYSGSIEVSGGIRPLTWGLASGSLPEGISLGKDNGLLSGIPQVPGIYGFAIQVEDAAGAKASQGYQIIIREPADTDRPSAITDLRALYRTSTTAILSWSAPLDDSLTGTAAVYDLRYSSDCPPGMTVAEAWWDSAIQASGEPRPMAGAFHTYTLNGLEARKIYCVAVRSIDASGHLSEISNLIGLQDEIYDGMGDNASGLITLQYPLRKGYNLISVPLIPVPDNTSIFEDDIGSPVSLYRWYSAHPGLTPPQWYMEGAVQPGHGYFLYAPEEGISLDVSGLAVTDTQTHVHLQEGWNMIGNPYTTALVLKDAQVRNLLTGETKTFEEAARGGWVGNSLYAFKGMGYEFLAVNSDPPAIMEPWEGYWLYADGNGDYEVLFKKP